MSRSPFDPDFAALPSALPVFPLTGVLLLPGGRLPLNIFEERYLAMIQDALGGRRVIGMVQPRAEHADMGAAPLYRTGCAGRITAFSETADGRYLITLSGLIRFDIVEELPGAPGGYRRVRPDFDRFRGDLAETDGAIDRVCLLRALSNYFDSTGIEGDWEAMDKTSDEDLVTSLAMVCPFEPPEKQALLEAMTLPERAETMTAILRMSCVDGDGDGARH